MKKTIMQQNCETIVSQLEQGISVLIKWKWTESKAKGTYGQCICTCYANDLKIGRSMGGGYPLDATSMEDLLIELAKIKNNPIKIKGGEGLSHMLNFTLAQLGYKYKNQYDYNNKCYGNYYIIYK